MFGDRKSGAYLHKFLWTHILRRRIVKHQASPDDPTLADYWAWRRRKSPLPIDKTSQELTGSLAGRCAICKAAFLPDGDRPQTAREWERWLVTRTVITMTTTHPGTSEEAAPRLVHAECRKALGPELRHAY